jgi:hypothetical protein
MISFCFSILKELNSHIPARHGSELWVIESSLCRQVEIVQQYRIVALLYRHSPDIVGREEGEGQGGDLGGNGMSDIHIGRF